MDPTRQPSIWERLDRRELIAGIFVSFSDCRLVELVASQGFDFIFLDNEHGLTSPSELRDCIRSAAVFDVPVVVRVSGPYRSEIGKTLDCGAAGIVLPRAEDPEDLLRVVSYTRYSPAGERGRGPSVPWLARIQGSGSDGLFPGVIAIVESLRGVQRVDELVTVPGVSGILPGPGDLAQELGGLGRNSPELNQILARINDAVVRRSDGPALIAFCPGPTPDVAGALTSGASGILVGPDTAFLQHSCVTSLARVRGEHGGLTSEFATGTR